MNKKIIIYPLLIIIILQIAIAIEPTQTYSKIYLTPFYRESMTSNTNYTYILNVNPPDRISEVKNAIISFNAQINGQTQNFTLWVNGQSCNTPSYYIATAYSTTGNVQFYFDCSNIITKTGNYNVTMKSAVNTGAITSWLDLTYMNNPTGTAELMGTEYQAGDNATIFLQLKDNQGLPIDNGSCYLDVYYPASYNATHPEMFNNAPMLFKEEGIYYYDLITPSYTGVYMTTATCSYAFDWIWIYPMLELVYSPTRQAISGTWAGATVNLNNPEDGAYDSCVTSGSGTCQANYTFNISRYGDINNMTNINLYYIGEETSAKVLIIAYWNGTAFVNLSNTLTFVATGSSTAPSGIDQLVTNSIPLNGNINGTITIRLTIVHTSTATLYNNWLSLALLSAVGTVQELKGSSEMHISNIVGGIIINITANITTQLQQLLTNIIADNNLTRNQITALNQTILSLQTNMANNFTNIQNLLSTINGQNNLTQAMITNTNLTIHQSITDTQNLINALNTTLLTQFNITNNNTQNYINQLQSNITSQINALTIHIDGQYNNLLALLQIINQTTQGIYIQVNLTDQRLINFSISTNQTLQQILTEINTNYNLTSQELTQIQNYLINMNNNISLNFQNIQNNLTSINTQQNLTIQQLEAINTTINQNIFNTQNLIISINQTILNQFNITNTKINDLQLNLTNQLSNLQINITGQLNNILNYLIIINQTTTETKNLAQQIWDYITSWLNGTINTIEYKLDLLLNVTNITLTPITVNITTESCITDSDWIIQANVYGNYHQILDNNTIACNITTTLWNLSIMTYQPEGYFEYRNTCPAPNTWNWSVTCNYK